MRSIGNDIVALNKIDVNRTKQPGFYTKFITDAELALYNGHLPFENFAWLLWSIKEAAYKFKKRVNNQLVFSPKKIVVGSIAPLVSQPGYYAGCVMVDDSSLRYQSFTRPDFIHSVVSNTCTFNNICQPVKAIGLEDYESQYTQVRQLAMATVQSSFGNTGNFCIIKDEAGCPWLTDIKQNISIPVSLSHHGGYVAFAVEKG